MSTFQPTVPGTTIPTTSRGALWFGFIGGLLAWFAHLVLAYTIGEFGCVSATDRHTWLGVSAVAWMILGATVVTFVPAGLAMLVAFRAYNQLVGDGGEEVTEPGRPLLASAGLFLSGIAALTILVQTLPVLFYLRDCGHGFQ